MFKEFIEKQMAMELLGTENDDVGNIDFMDMGKVMLGR